MAETTVVKSPGDTKLYRYLELDNRLKVLLVSDSDADKSAAALDVHIGNGSDPDEWAGLAHFLEHMLFLGTEKFPTAGEYQSFIKQNGGSNNAYTSFDHTNYYFSISPDFLEPALDRFSRFFIDPTFDAVYVDRERAVVHSEYQARKKDESRRLWDAQKNWLNPGHPASRFSVGSLHTLRDREQSSARDRLLSFYRQFYSANIMSLVVVGREPLDQLEQWVAEKFSEIRDRDVEPQYFAEPYFDPGLVPARLDTVPEKEQHSISFQFPVPTTLEEYNSKPFSYIANLLGHEGQGSLHSRLKELGWAESLSAGSGYMDKIQGVFSVRIGLTREGVAHIDEIGKLLFQEIALIRQSGIEKWRFDEQSRLAEIAFRFAQERDPGRLAQSLASRLQFYPADQVLSGPYTMTEFRPKRIKELLGFLRPGNVNLQVVSPGVETDRVSEYYDVSYAISPVSDKVIESWSSVDSGGGDTASQLALPEQNPFIPERLSLLDVPVMSSSPALLENDSDIELWYRQDAEYGSPRANFYFNVMSPVARSSARNLVLTELYVRIVNSQLNHTVYPAYLADVNYSLYRHGRGFSVRISGFEDQQTVLLTLVVDALRNPEFDADKFGIIRDRYARQLKNVARDAPSSQVIHEVYRLLMKPYWTESERLAELENISTADLQSFHKAFYEKVDVVALSHGDVSAESSRHRAAIVASLFEQSERISNVDHTGIRKLDGETVYLRSMDIDHTDAALAVYFQGAAASREERAKTSLIKTLLESPFYNQLRTVNQVGYLVHTGTIEVDRHPGLFFAVQSPGHSPEQLNALYNEFIADFADQLEQMPLQQFESIRAGLVDRILRKPQKLGDRTSRYWREIDNNELDFDSKLKFAEAVEMLSLEDMKDYYRQLLIDRGGDIIVQSTGTSLAGAIPGGGYKVTGDPVQFRNSFR